MSDSIHVPSAAVKRWKALAKFVLPVVGIAAGTAWTTTWSWIQTRPSTSEVEELTSKSTAIATQAKGDAQTNHVQIDALQNTALELARMAVELHAQAEVARAYRDSKRWPEYVASARRFYSATFERELEEHPGELVRALKATQRAVWRPDRD